MICLEPSIPEMNLLWEEIFASFKRHPISDYVKYVPNLFGVHLAMIQEKFMIANIDGVPLFPLINYMRTVHCFPQYEAPAEHPVANIN